GPIYGNVTTSGGSVTHSGYNISGTIDNNVPFTIPPVVRPDTTTFGTGSGSTLNLPSGTTPGDPAKYVYGTLSGGLTINGRTLGGLGLVPVETYVLSSWDLLVQKPAISALSPSAQGSTPRFTSPEA